MDWWQPQNHPVISRCFLLANKKVKRQKTSSFCCLFFLDIIMIAVEVLVSAPSTNMLKSFLFRFPRTGQLPHSICISSVASSAYEHNNFQVYVRQLGSRNSCSRNAMVPQKRATPCGTRKRYASDDLSEKLSINNIKLNEIDCLVWIVIFHGKIFMFSVNIFFFLTQAFPHTSLKYNFAKSCRRAIYLAIDLIQIAILLPLSACHFHLVKVLFILMPFLLVMM